MSTQVLDHIIKTNKSKLSKKAALVNKLKNDEEEGFVQALITKKEAMKEVKRQKKLRCMSQNASMQKSPFSEEESEISSDQSERAIEI